MNYLNTPPLPADPVECLHQGCLRPWEVDVPPFAVAPRTWYVGNKWVGAYLLESSAGLILIDTTMQPQVYLVLENIRRLGFDPRDIRLILASHIHYDHIGGVRPIQELSGAQVYVSQEDWDFLQERPKMLLAFGQPYGAFLPDAFYSDDKPVRLGDREIRTHLTPGHTPGTTSFFFDAIDTNGTVLRCGLHGGIGLNTLARDFIEEFDLDAKSRDDYLASMLRVRDFPVDVTLGSHPAQVGMIEKIADIRPGHNPFHDPKIWQAMIDDRIARVQALMEEVQ